MVITDLIITPLFQQLYACTNARMYVCQYACMYVYIYMNEYELHMFMSFALLGASQRQW